MDSGLKIRGGVDSYHFVDQLAERVRMNNSRLLSVHFMKDLVVFKRRPVPHGYLFLGGFASSPAPHNDLLLSSIIGSYGL